MAYISLTTGWPPILLRGNSDALKVARDLDAKIEAILTAAAK